MAKRPMTRAEALNQKVSIAVIARALFLTKRRVGQRAKEESWTYSEIKVPGGTQRLYRVETLPLGVLEKLVDHLTSCRLVDLMGDQPAVQPEALTKEQVTKAGATEDEAPQDHSRELIISLLHVLESDARRRAHRGEVGFESAEEMIWELNKIYRGWNSK